MLAVSDANNMFTLFDVGAEGRRSDGGVLFHSEIGHRLMSDDLSLPPPSKIEDDGPRVPYFLVGDEALGLSRYMMRPYPRCDGLTLSKRVFNYRLSRDRRTVECAFGILSARWRIFKKLIQAKTENVIKMVQATMALHNFLIRLELNMPLDERIYSAGLTRKEKDLPHAGLVRIEEDEDAEDLSVNAAAVRDELRKYFCISNVLPNQWERARTYDY